MDFRLSGSSVHMISQARTLEWVALLFSRGSSLPRDRIQVSCTAGGFFTDSLQGSPNFWYWEKYLKQVFSGMEQYWVVCGSKGSMWGKLHIFPGLLSRRNQGIVEQRPTESWAEETEVRIWGCVAAEICGTQCIREEGSEQRLQKPLKWLPRVLHNTELCLHMTRFLEAQQSTITQEQIVS